MGDVRFRPLYERLRDSADPLAVLREYSDQDVIGALAAAPRHEDPYLVNVLATEAMNRAERVTKVARIMAEGVVMLDVGGRVTYVNPAAERLLGVTRSGIAGQSFDAFAHAPHVAPHKECAVEDARTRKVVVASDDEFLRSASGRVFPAHLSAAPVLRQGEFQGLVIVFHDVTSRKSAERLARRHTAFEQVLARVSARLVSPARLEDALAACVQDLGHVRGATRSFMNVNEGATPLRERTFEWCAEGVTPCVSGVAALAQDPWWRHALSERRPVVVPDFSELPPEAHALADAFPGDASGSVLAHPVIVEGRVQGFLGCQHALAGRAMNDSDLTLVKLASEVIGRALEGAARLRDARFLAHCLDHAGACVWIVNGDGRFEFVNATAVRRYGYALDVFESLDVFALNPEMTRESWAHLWKLIKARGSMTVHSWHQDAAGRKFPVDVEASHVEFDESSFALAVVHDVTAHAKRQVELQREAEAYRVLFEHHPDAVYVIDAKGVVQDANAASAGLTGHASNELAGRHLTELVDPEHHARLRALMKEALHAPRKDQTLTLVRKDGSRVDVAFTLIPRHVTGASLGVYGVAREIPRSADV